MDADGHEWASVRGSRDPHRPSACKSVPRRFLERGIYSFIHSSRSNREAD